MVRRLLLFVLFALPLTGFAQLTIADAYFEDYDHRVIRNQKVPAGETIYLSFRVAGFRQDEKHDYKLAWFIDCTDPRNVPVTETATNKIEGTLSPQDEKWRPKVDWSMPVPSFAPTGEYHVAIRVHDELANKDVSQTMTFQVTGEEVKPAEALEIRDFEFADSENGKAKATPVYNRGTTLWARFKVVGFQIGKEKELAVEVDLSVRDSENKVLFSKEKAADEKYKSFYPPRFVTETFNLDIQPNLKVGDYIIHLDVRDMIGQTKAIYDAKFTVQ